MRKATSAIAVLLLTACSGQEANQQGAGNGAAAAGDAPQFQPGQYETTVEIVRMNIPNMPAGMTTPTPPPTTVSYCLTPEQAARPDASFITGSGEASGCEYQNFSMSGGRMSGTVQCAAQGTQMRSTFEGTFTATGYEITQQAETSAGGVTTEMETRTRSRRVGDCG